MAAEEMPPGGRGRTPLDPAVVRSSILAHPPWRDVQVLGSTSSTNDVVADAARAGAGEGLVVVADEQRAGRGRLDRSWVSPPRAGLTLSVLLRPAVVPERWPWLPLVAGVAAARSLGAVSGLDVRLKWPNDLLVRGAKVGGLLAEVTAGAVVVGLGVNVTTTRQELPRADATSLSIELGRSDLDRGALLADLVVGLGGAYLGWSRTGGDPAGPRAAYRAVCDTIGSAVTVGLPDGAVLRGRAVDVDVQGRLVVESATGLTALSAGDVTHVRPDA
ncbi:MAG TPA: biotin--[acetyl-CoA-carboxylase] ligase [Mycobacteriales bacterium]|nr:biotin--[acetyl-CoA-carboxylase] ligase [Mycobacteriales bacterium]